MRSIIDNSSYVNSRIIRKPLDSNKMCLKV